MKLPVHVHPSDDAPVDVDYRWDPGTDILTARMRRADLPVALLAVAEPGAGHQQEAVSPDALVPLPLAVRPGDPLSGAIGLEGRDGSWLMLDVESGALAAIEVAVWPSVRHLPSLEPPVARRGRVELRTARRNGAGSPLPDGGFSVSTRVAVESDTAKRTLHFQIGSRREASPVRVGPDLLVDVDADGHLAGLWLLNVPPVPSVT